VNPGRINEILKGKRFPEAEALAREVRRPAEVGNHSELSFVYRNSRPPDESIRPQITLAKG
jgi:hypothetical protein